MIVTLCVNPCFDRMVEVDSMSIGGTNRIRASRTDLGGKGVNVSRVLKRLGVASRCVGVMGRENAEKLTALMDAEKLEYRFSLCRGSVRTNMKIISRDGQAQTELNEAGPMLNEEEQCSLMALLRDQAKDMTCCVLTGSLPGGCAGMYRRIMEQMEGVKCLLDASGEELMNGLAARPWLIKPNIDELQAALGETLNTQQEILQAARRMIALGAQHVIVSMGGDGAMLVTPDEAWFAPAVSVPVRSTVGAGDSMVGGLLYGLSKGGSLAEAFRYGVAAAACSVMNEGTQLLEPGDFEPMLGRATLMKLE